MFYYYEMKYYLKRPLILIFVCNLLFAKTNTSTELIPHYVWDSDSSNIGPAQVWFQDWTDYTRLFIKSIPDTSIVEKHPYAKTDFKKTYMNANEYKIPNYKQLLGNINWKEIQSWEEGHSNNFEWFIDRDQNWTYTNKILNGSAKILNNKLHLQIKDYNKVIIDLVLRYRKYK